MATQVGGRYSGPTLLHSAAAATANSTALTLENPGIGVYDHVTLQVTGTFVASLVLQGTVDGTNYVTIEVQNTADTSQRLVAMSAAGVYLANVTGFYKIRTSLTWTSGTSITVNANLVYGGEVVPPSSDDTYLTLTPTMDTSAYAAGDVWFTATQLSNVGRVAGGIVYLQAITIVDKDDQTAAAIDVYFFDRTVTFGTFNVAPSISDADSLFFMGYVSFAAADFKDLGGTKVACIKNIGLEMKPSSTSLWVAAVCSGTPTQTASGVQLGFGFIRA